MACNYQVRSGIELQSSEVGGKRVTTLPPAPVVFITLFHNVLNSYKSILVHFIFVFAFIESSHELFNIMLNINVMISETMNKRKISLCIATKLLRPNKSKEL